MVQVRRSLKIRSRRKEKEKLPSGITADYSAEFFAHLNQDIISERGSGSGGGGGGGADTCDEAASNSGRSTLENNSCDIDNAVTTNISYSDSSEASLHSIGNKKVKLISHAHTHYH